MGLDWKSLPYGHFGDFALNPIKDSKSRRRRSLGPDQSNFLNQHITPSAGDAKGAVPAVVYRSRLTKHKRSNDKAAMKSPESDTSFKNYIYNVYYHGGAAYPAPSSKDDPLVATLPEATLDTNALSSMSMFGNAANNFDLTSRMVMVTFDQPYAQTGARITRVGTYVDLDIYASSLGSTFVQGALGGGGGAYYHSSATGTGPTASSKIGGDPPCFDGAAKNGSVCCPGRDPIPLPSRYDLDQSMPYGSKLNPMTPKCRLLPKSNDNLVPYFKATSTYGEAAAQIKVSWKEVSGESLTDAQASVLVGQWGSETGGGKSYFNWNPGGIKAYSRWTGKWVLIRTFEYASEEARACGSDCRTWVFSPFRAFDSQAESITSWIRLLTGSRHRVGKPFILAADYMGYARAIGNKEQGGSGYGTADAEKYGKLIKKLGERWMAGTYT